MGEDGKNDKKDDLKYKANCWEVGVDGALAGIIREKSFC